MFEHVSLNKYILLCCILFIGFSASAAERIQPFILAFESSAAMDTLEMQVQNKLAEADFTIVGKYRPYDGAAVIAFTNDKLKAVSLKSERGGYGAVLRVSITDVAGKKEVSYTNPIYWANAFRLNDSLSDVAATLRSVLGFVNEFGSGEKVLSASAMRKFHYTIMMEYFDDPSELGEYSNHEEAVKTIENNLASGKGAAHKVYELPLGKDVDGKEMTLFGVALKGKDEKDCSGDNYIMSRIDKSEPRHTAHLPYEILVYGNKVEALYARFRIAISWPHLPMMRSETGATFFSIMCSPGAIEDALEEVAGG